MNTLEIYGAKIRNDLRAKPQHLFPTKPKIKMYISLYYIVFPNRIFFSNQRIPKIGCFKNYFKYSVLFIILTESLHYKKPFVFLFVLTQKK